MSAAIKDGGPAFPQTQTLMNSGFPDMKVREVTGGMTLRDWFAGQALMSMLSPIQEIKPHTPAKAAQLSYSIADAMLAAREGRAE